MHHTGTLLTPCVGCTFVRQLHPKLIRDPHTHYRFVLLTRDCEAAEAHGKNQEGDGDALGVRIAHHQQKRGFHAEACRVAGLLSAPSPAQCPPPFQQLHPRFQHLGPQRLFVALGLEIQDLCQIRVPSHFSSLLPLQGRLILSRPQL